MATDRGTSIRATQLRNFEVTGWDIKDTSISGSRKLIDGTVTDVKLASSYIYADGTRAFTGNIQANASGTLDIGSESLPFNNIHTTNMYASEIASVGVDDTVAGSIHIYGGSLTSENGYIKVYNNAVSDAGNEWYWFTANNDGCLIGTEDDTDSLAYYRSANRWGFTNGALSLGLSDLRSSYLYHFSGIVTGCFEYYYVPRDYDDTIDFYQISCPSNSDDWTFGPVTDIDSLMYDGGENKWKFTGANGLYIANNLNVDSDVTVSGSILPAASGTSDLGSLDLPFKDLYLTGDSLYINGVKAVGYTGGEVTFYGDGSNLNGITASGGGGGVTTHSGLSGLDADDHTQYILHAHGVGTGTKNVAGGTSAGTSLTTGDFNTVLGYQAGQSLTAGGWNTIMGYLAGASQDSYYMVAIGMYAAQSTNADYNVAIGYSALLSNQTGTHNVAIGSRALEGSSTKSQSRNIGIGSTVGQGLTTGGRNTMIGDAAGYFITTGANNVFLGANAGANVTVADSSVLIGYQAAYNQNTPDWNVMVGYQTGFYNVTGNRNVTLGGQAGRGVSTKSYSSSVFVGYQCGYVIEDGDNNTGVGAYTFNALSTGQYNATFGYYSGRNNATGSNNTTLGAYAGYGVFGNNYVNNTLVGYSAGYGISDGIRNVIMGHEAGRNIASGDRNVILGYQSAYNATGSDNVFIGHGAGYSETGDDKLYIHNTGIATPLIYGDFSAGELTINGDITVTEDLYLTQSGTAPASAGDTGTQGEIRWTDDYIYVCTDTDTWRRAALTPW